MNIIYLIDSITKKVGGMYTPLLSQQLPEMMLHLMKTATVKERDSLCKMRQTWKLLLAADILEKMDLNIRQIDSNWPYTQTEIKLLDEVKSVDNEMETLRKEIALLEQQLQQPQQQQQQSEKLCKNKKRSRIEVTVGEKPPKKQQVEKISTIQLNQNNVDLLRSSVLLTPSPEPSKCASDERSFWVNFGGKKSTSEDFMGKNDFLPFLSEPMCEDDNKVIDTVEIIDESLQTEQMDTEETSPNTDLEQEITTVHQSPLEQQLEEEIQEDDGLQLIEQDIPFIDLDDFVETAQIIPAALIKAEPKRSGFGEESEEEDEDEEITDESILMSTPEKMENYRKTPPLNIDMYGNIEHQPAAEMVKANKIKFNLTTVNITQSCEQPKKDVVVEKPKPKKPSDWETPSIPFEVKKSMRNVRFQQKPILRKGHEASGMCSIM